MFCMMLVNHFNTNINTTLNTGAEIGNPWKTFWAVGCTGRGLWCTRHLDSAWTFCTSVENVCADTVSVRMFQTDCFCFKATFSYCQKLSLIDDLWTPGSLFQTPHVEKVQLLQKLGNYGWWSDQQAWLHDTFFTMSLSRCLPLGCLEYQGPSSAVLCKGLQ